MADFRISSRTAATVVAAVTRRNPFSQENPPRYRRLHLLELMPGGFFRANSAVGSTRQAAHPHVVGVGGSAGFSPASARLGVWMGKTPRFPDRSGVLTLKRRKRRAP